MNHTLSDSQLEEMIKSAVNSSGPLPPDEKFSLLISALRELQERRRADSEPVAEVVSMFGDPEVFGERELKLLVGIQNMPYGTKFYRHAQQPVIENEPVAEVLSSRPGNDTSTIDRALPVGTKLYRHAQPAPVVPEKATVGEMPFLGTSEGAYVRGWNDCRAAMLQAGNSPVIPEGYVMVPKRPTKEILDEFDSIIDYGAEDSVDAWGRLLAAAPQEVQGE